VSVAKLKPCRWCESLFEPVRPLQVVCSPPCAVNYGREKAAKARIKEARKAKREYRKKSMSLSKLKNLAQREVNRWIRFRDRNLGCVSCHMPASYEGPWHAGHYRSRGAAEHLRFHEDNIWKQCSQCNEHKSGNSIAYRQELVRRIGLERVLALENDNSVRRWTREELVAIRKDALIKRKTAEQA